MFDTSQESPVKSPPVRMSESPTPCSGYDCRDERAMSWKAGPWPLSPYTSLLTSIHLYTCSPCLHLSVHSDADAVGLSLAALWTELGSFNQLNVCTPLITSQHTRRLIP